jgi:transposase
MTARSTTKPSKKPRTSEQRTALRLAVEQRVKDATPAQKTAHKALTGKRKG